MLFGEEQLKCAKERRVQNKFAILKCPKFWRDGSEVPNLRTNSFKGPEKYEAQWVYLYNTTCDICKLENICTKECTHKALCKLFVMKVDKGVVRVRKMSANANLPIGAIGARSGCNSICNSTNT